MRWIPFIALVVAGALAVPASADAPASEAAVVSSTTLTADGPGPFTMTVSNLGDSALSLELPAPRSGDVTVDEGTWDGASWSLLLAPGETATMTDG